MYLFHQYFFISLFAFELVTTVILYQPEWLSLTFLAGEVYWSAGHKLWISAYLGMFNFSFVFGSHFLPDTELFFDSDFLSAFSILPCPLPSTVSNKKSAVTLLRIPRTGILPLDVFQDFLFASGFWQFGYNVVWYRLLCIRLPGIYWTY